MPFPNTLRTTAWRQVVSTLVLAAAAGALAASLHVPLPWMIGPLFAVAGARMCDIDLRPLPGGRQSGQWAIGAALGLYFSPEVVAQLGLHAPLVLAAALGSLAVGMVCALIMRRLGGVDAATAFFAALPGGASEMANLADRHGGAVDRIAAAHALRVMLVVSLLPFALTFAGVQGSDLYVPLVREVDARTFPLLVGASLLGVAAFKLLRIANAWVLGPLLGVAVATLAGVPLSALPAWVVNGGQLLIGCALGCRFSRAFFRAAPRFMAVAALHGGRRADRGAVDRAVLRAGRAARPVVHGAPAHAVARHRARRRVRDVHHRQGAATRRAAGHGVPCAACGGADGGRAVELRPVPPRHRSLSGVRPARPRPAERRAASPQPRAPSSSVG